MLFTAAQVLLGNLLTPPPHNFIASISAENGGVIVPPASFKAGLEVLPGATLDVLVVRTVQATDPTPTSAFASTFGFNTVANGTGTAISATATSTVTIFHPSVTIGLGVSPTTASVGTTLTYTVTVHNTSTSNSPNLIFNAPFGNLAKGSAVITGLSSVSTLHAFVGEFVWGPGIPVNTKISVVGTTSVTLNKVATATTVGGQFYFGFGPAIIGGVQQPFVPPPLGFVIPPAVLSVLTNFAPGQTVQFTYTHVVTATDPNPLKNTLDMFFYMQFTEAHPVTFPNRIHGPSNTVSTSSTLSKTMFF
jgi:hypothetical protein